MTLMYACLFGLDAACVVYFVAARQFGWAAFSVGVAAMNLAFFLARVAA